MLKDRYIVLVEDDEIMGGSLLQRLELEGAEVLWLKQMVRALGAIRTPKKPIDAVICDIGLPDGSGEELFSTLLRTGRAAALPLHHRARWHRSGGPADQIGRG